MFKPGLHTASCGTTLNFTQSDLTATVGNHNPCDPSKYETPLSATYLRQMINGEEVVLLDYLANIFWVNGEDQLRRYRKDIGQAKTQCSIAEGITHGV
ncbi:phage major tail tube protein [Pseudomonas kribbensis]|uniref:Uncharacterized protein n=1 Tax=Pseudomonas kribbensis TaxID=1628086 RepID=A0A4Y8VEF2_9PSED|nr:phage major tail tube protein [Pseudomonas kribbensis]TFH79222.1 hypothetical protein E4J90_17785 [Pseudomonas kribbensis]